MHNRFDHGDDSYRYDREIVADFSTNAWYLGPDPLLLDHLKEKICLLGSYPEPYAESFVKEIAKKYAISTNSVLACNGTIEAIFLIARLFAGKKSRIMSPTFSEYEHACQVNNHTISFCGSGFIREGMQTDFDLFWICNPNNPTGQVIKPDSLLTLVRNNPQTTFVVDEAYADFCMDDITLDSKAGQIENLIVLKSLTKNNCLSGLRLGYILCHPAMGKRLKAIQAPWSVNALAVEAGKYVLEHPRITIDDLITYQSLAQQLLNEISHLGCEVQSSKTGYFLLKTPLEASVVKDYLVNEMGVLVRDASNFRTLTPFHIRVASLSVDKNQLLISGLKKCLSEANATHS
ncbi:pyridoxal phosphate-dependent aminotransferase [Carboxylicivirga caseinilyticus]|uniref:pyridoxal phosphate-dependent aminotransferase n=1 Tax=Carboxylicivirga caseinilyticus TaxID=3417572 RepID=UPI003D32A352|nr:aminotransferase class I/II-fold pyridoxal phosphate-dependent enzyme [Marinilabiliaceae bacterium A049]